VRSGKAANFGKSFTVTPGGKLTLKVDRGDVHVSGGAQNTVEVRVTRKVTRADEPTADRIIEEHRVEMEENENGISITAQAPPSLDSNSLLGLFTRPNLDVHYEITVPAQWDVELRTAGGVVNVSDVKGSLTATTLGGDMRFANIPGAVDAQTMGGNIHATKCNGSLLVKTAGGEITIEDFAGPFVKASTAGGDISADFAAAPTSYCDLRTAGGGVVAKLPGSAKLTLDAETMGGEVTSDLKVQTAGKHQGGHLQGTINGGGPVLKLRTMGGDIKVVER
jgi:DUF4097 and DUF4098 domain-containing protein YvlB